MRRHRLFLLFTILTTLLAACLPINSPVSPSPVATLVPSASPSRTASPVPSTTVTLPPATATSIPTYARRVLILSIDGLRPDAIALAPMPNLIGLMHNGATTLVAQTIYPSSTLPAHVSMLTGLCPAKHGVNWNDYELGRGYASGTDLFDLAHSAGFQTIMIVGKEKLSQVTEPTSLDIFKFINDRDLVITNRITEDFPNNFGVLFIHFPTTDWMGHEYGWLSPEQLSVLRRADEALGFLLAALDTANLRNGTLIIVTADHGGHNFTHGSSLAEDMTIPWIAAGSGVVATTITEPVNTTDTAATAAFALGLPLPPEWDGIPVYEAFGLQSPLRPEPRCP